MSDLLVDNETGEVRWPASFNSLLAFSGISMSRTDMRPITAGNFTLHRPLRTEQPVGDKVREVRPVLIDGVWTQAWEARDYTIDELQRLKSEAKSDIDRQAEQQRMRYMTPGEGKATVYQEKIKEAAAYRADAIPGVGLYPAGSDLLVDGQSLESIVQERYTLLAATIGIDGNTLDEVVVVIENMKRQWKRIAADIERKGKLAQLAVDEAATGAEISAAKLVEW